MPGVLQGLQVVEFTHMVAGPACGQVLGDFGADVIKVEPPQGDITRRIGPMAGDMTALYASTNRNKKVVCLDITDPEGAKQARELALKADVTIANLDSAMLERAGLDGASLRRDAPQLICVEITGFGHGGPAGTDGLAQAAMGLMATTGAPEGPTFRTGPSVVDVSTGVWAALGVMAALENRRQTNKGDFIQASLADVCLYMQYPHITMYGAAPDTVRRNGNHSVVACTPKFEASDGMIQVTVLHQRHWRALCEHAGAPGFADDPRFATTAQLCAAQPMIEQLFNPMMRKRTRGEWVEKLRAARLPCGPERDYSEVTVDAELFARGMLYRLGPRNASTLQVRMPLEFTTTPCAIPEAPAGLSAGAAQHGHEA